MKTTDEQFKQNLDLITEQDITDYKNNKIKNIQSRQLKTNHESIINSLNSKQYFKWHNNFFQGDLDYKSQAFGIFHSTRSKKVRALCLVQIEYYDSIFGTTGFQLKNEVLNEKN